jgi:hypothetical protein
MTARCDDLPMTAGRIDRLLIRLASFARRDNAAALFRVIPPRRRSSSHPRVTGIFYIVPLELGELEQGIRAHSQRWGQALFEMRRRLSIECLPRDRGYPWHRVPTKHLAAYLQEMTWRFNNRKNPYVFRGHDNETHTFRHFRICRTHCGLALLVSICILCIPQLCQGDAGSAGACTHIQPSWM